MYDDINFDSLEEIQIPFKFKGQQYVLVEPDGECCAAYINARMTGTEIDRETGKVVRVTDGLGNLEVTVVSLCVRYADYNEETKIITVKEKVPLDVVKHWPQRLIGPLYQKAKLIGELDGKRKPVILNVRCPGCGKEFDTVEETLVNPTQM